MDRESEVSGAVRTCLTMMGKPGVRLGGIPTKESSFMVFVFVFFFELRDREVPDAPCKTMPHRGKPGKGSVRSSSRPP